MARECIGRIKPNGSEVFVIAGDDGKEAMQGFAAAGPKGACLATYVEIRGLDDYKVMARIVK
jgi:hypothetical protein